MNGLPPYTPDRMRRVRRPSRAVRVGGLTIGGGAPLVVQSMCTTPTRDLAATVGQCVSLADCGCQMVRITAPTVADAAALAAIRRGFDAAGHADVPLVADIHFSPEAALEAARHVEKVRINPGNYADRRYPADPDDDIAFAAARERVAERFLPLVRVCRQEGRAMRIGVNHGSLAERIVLRHGDTPAGMVAAALEFVDIAESADYRELVISLKSSNPLITVRAYRLLAASLAGRGTPYPFHLGVTEAGDGLEGRIKGAVGIGALLEDGIGDTIRVSLTEAPEAEIPVAKHISDRYDTFDCTPCPDHPPERIDPENGTPRPSRCLGGAPPLGGEHPPCVLAAPEADDAAAADRLLGPVDLPLEHLAGSDTPLTTGEPRLTLLDLPAADPAGHLARLLPDLPADRLVGIAGTGGLGTTRAYRLLAAALAAARRDLPICLHLAEEHDPLDAAATAGGLLLDGIGDALHLPRCPHAVRTAFTILQATRRRITRAEFIACPGCGRTLFDLPTVTAHVKEATAHLDGVTIAVMGCIVNGPGEMADADYGFVGAGRDRVDLYRRRECIRRGIPFADARDALVDLIKDDDRWREPDRTDRPSEMP